MMPRESLAFLRFFWITYVQFGTVCVNRNPISALQKWKIHFSWDEPKIGLRDGSFPSQYKKSLFLIFLKILIFFIFFWFSLNFLIFLKKIANFLKKIQNFNKHIYTYTYTYTYTYIPTYIHIHMHAYIYTAYIWLKRIDMILISIRT
jgi:hypothetical protein